VAPPVTPLPPTPPLPPSRPPQLWQRPSLWAVLALNLLLLLGVGFWLRQRSAVPRDVTPFTVTANSGSLPGVVSASGELDAMQRVNVSPKRQGVLRELYVDEGDIVQAGQPIALMDDGDLKDRLDEYRDNLLAAEAQLGRTLNEWQRRRSLYQSGAISADQYNAALSAYQVDMSARNAAAQRLDQRQVESSELIVRAPFAGVISQRFAEPGAFVTPTTTASATAGATSSSIVELAQGLEVLAKVPESDLGRLQKGMTASVRVDAFPQLRFPARVRQIAPRAVKVNNVTSFEVKLVLLRPAPELRIGMSADIDFQTGQKQADTLVPTVAIVTEKGKPGVLLVGENQEPTFQPVELGLSSGKNTEILGGLEAGTRVFIDLPPWAKKRKES